jgi:hypothetical protein
VIVQIGFCWRMITFSDRLCKDVNESADSIEVGNTLSG